MTRAEQMQHRDLRPLYASPRLPLWCRVWVYALANCDQSGQVRLRPGELRRAIDSRVRPQEVSRAISNASTRGLLAPGSTARCLIVRAPR